MGMRKFWSVALPFGKVACVVKVLIELIISVGSMLRYRSKD